MLPAAVFIPVVLPGSPPTPPVLVGCVMGHRWMGSEAEVGTRCQRCAREAADRLIDEMIRFARWR